MSYIQSPQKITTRAVPGLYTPITLSQGHYQNTFGKQILNVNCNCEIASKEDQPQDCLDIEKEIRSEIQSNQEILNDIGYSERNKKLNQMLITKKSKALQEVIEPFGQIKTLMHKLNENVDLDFSMQDQPINFQDVVNIGKAKQSIQQILRKYRDEEEDQQIKIRALPNQYHNSIRPPYIDSHEYLNILKEQGKKLSSQAQQLQGKMKKSGYELGLLKGKIRACHQFIAGSNLKTWKFKRGTFCFDLKYINAEIDSILMHLRS